MRCCSCCGAIDSDEAVCRRLEAVLLVEVALRAVARPHGRASGHDDDHRDIVEGHRTLWDLLTAALGSVHSAPDPNPETSPLAGGGKSRLGGARPLVRPP